MANMVALGALVALTDVCQRESLDLATRQRSCDLGVDVRQPT